MIENALLAVLFVLVLLGLLLCCTPGFFTPSRKRYKRPYGLHAGNPLDDAALSRLKTQARDALAKERRRAIKCVK